MSDNNATLLVDIGNSRVKWGWLIHERIETGTPFATGGIAAFETLLHALGHGPPAQIVVSNVAGAKIASDLQALTERHWGFAPRFVRPKVRGYGVTNGYANPEKLGVDRWVGLIGGRHAHRGSVCVADCGTALTFDALNAEGEHLGGLIAPGLFLMHQALVRGTSDLPEVVGKHRNWLGRDTAAAISSGTLGAGVGLIERAFRETARRLGNEPRLLLTGGDAPEIATELEISYESRPDLVLEGLGVIAGCN